jgi:hypothetical protein
MGASMSIVEVEGGSIGGEGVCTACEGNCRDAGVIVVGCTPWTLVKGTILVRDCYAVLDMLAICNPQNVLTRVE